MVPTENPFPRLCFVGPLLGRNPGWVTTQGEILADLFSKAGYPVITTSKIPNRWLRLVDTIYSLIARRKDMDVVIVSVFSGAAFFMAHISSWLVKILRKPLVLYLRGGNLPEFSKNYPFLVQKVLRRANCIVAPSGFLAEFANSHHFSVRIIPNVVKMDQYPYRLRAYLEPNILWMRTFHSIYNPEMAVEVLNEVRKVKPQAKMTMAGQEKGRLEEVRRLCEVRELQDALRFAGFLDLAGKQREFNSHDIFLNTNRVDNTPVSVLEAAAFGLPVVATQVGGIPYLLKDNHSALLVNDNDVHGMTQAVLRLLNEPELARRLSINGRALAECCDWKSVQPAWETVFSELLPNSLKNFQTIL